MLLRPLSTLRHLPIHSTQRSRELEQQTQASLPPRALMQRAGVALAKLALALRQDAASIGILCGSGNNGGDGLVAALRLHQAGVPVCAYLCAQDRPSPDDARWAREQAIQAGVPIQTGLPSPGTQHSLWIDALLGLGLTRAPEGGIAQGIAFLRERAQPVLSVDLPSGLCSERGQAWGDAVVQAQHTLCLLSLKPGLLTGQGRQYCGEIWFDDLGVPETVNSLARLGGPQLMCDWRAPMSLSRHSAHKGSRGDVLVLGGASGMQGAARLAARAALACGAGRVYVCLLADMESGHEASTAEGHTPDQGEATDPSRPELMRWPASQLRVDGETPRLAQDLTLVAGCGAGRQIHPHMPTLLTQARRLVLDADGLNAVATDPALQALLKQRRTHGQLTVLTPHPLEAARLLGCSSHAVQSDRLGTARQLAEQLDCVVLLKGSGSVIACPDNSAWINGSGHAALATPGTGDVLAGWLGGLWAQQHARWHAATPPFAVSATGAEPPAPPPALAQTTALTQLQTVAATAAYWHGLAAQAQHRGPMRAADLIEQMHGLH